MKTFEGNLIVKGWKFALAVSRFNALITSQLLQGARDCLLRHGASEDDLVAAWAPGAFELPLVARRMAESGSYQAVIALGAVIRGDTPHFDQVVSGVTRGIADVSLRTGVPVIFGVLTTDNLEQALERAGVKSGNKGWDAALSAIEMVSLLEGLG